MALKDILDIVAREEGISIDNQGERSTAIAKINEAAKDLYEKSDFKEALKEEVFDLLVESQTVSLPWYVEHIRGWRWFESRIEGVINDKGNRYQSLYRDLIWFKEWRHVKHSPLKRDITNAGPLTLSIPKFESETFSITIIGATPNSDRISETINWGIDEKEKTTTNAFEEPIHSIIKSGPTNYNITIKDIDGEELSVIPNHRTQSHYKIIQIFDYESPVIIQNNSAVEVLFKERFTPLVNDNDVFLFEDKYDKAIFWKFKEHNAKNLEAAQGYFAKCEEVIYQIQSSENLGMRRFLAFSPNAFLNYNYNATSRRSIR